MPTDADMLRAERTAVLTLLRQWTQAQIDSGLGPSDFNFTVEGENWSLESFRKAKLEEVRQLTELINQVSAPYIVRGRGRA